MQFIGNKAAHLYNGNVSKTDRKPKYPCTTCNKAVTTRSKAVSCDICEKWTHVQCTNSLSLDKYDALVLEKATFDYTCNLCIQNSLPFAHETVLDTSEHQIDTYPQRSEPLLDTSIHQNGTDPQLPETHLDCFKSKGLHFIGLNARSLLPKVSELRLFSQKVKPATISVSETWLDDSITDAEIELPGYSLERKDRNRQGGGVCLYIRNDLAYNRRSDLDTFDIESVWIHIHLPKTKPILIASVYRPPNQTDFLSTLEELLKTTEPSEETYILGDINICLSKSNIGLAKSYMNLLNNNGFTQLIDEPTRIAQKASILDHIMCNCSEKVSQSGVLPIGFSDHFLTFCTRKTVKQKYNSHNTVNIRSLKRYTTEAYQKSLASMDWAPVYQSSDPDTAWSHFREIFTQVLDELVPFKSVRIKQSTEKWMTHEILDKIHLRDKLIRRYQRNKSNQGLYKQYCKLRNEIQRDVKKAKSNYLESQLESNAKDPKKLWTNLKSLGYSKKTSSKANIVLRIANSICFNALDICNHINSFFINIASNLVKALPSPRNIYSTDSELFKNFYKKRGIIPGSFKLQPVSEEFIRKELNGLDPKKSTGLDNISPKFLKEGAEQLAPIISHIVNLSITSGIVPNELKEAKVSPLYKKNDKLEVGNYRPISVLNTVSKILEKSVHTQLLQYLTSNNLIYKYQSGFRPNHSTDTCLMYLTDIIKTEIAKGNFVGMMLLDVQKAFDSVNHTILCNKLYAMGVDPTWFKSYLSGRKQCVKTNGETSDFNHIQCGVPQGSLVGPLLYLCYSNDMCLSVQNRLLLYADDSVILVSDRDPSVISHKLGKELSSCNEWLIDNKLSLHVGKTECILFGPKSKLKNIENFEVHYNGQVIKGQKNVKYLGVLIDQELSGESMFSYTMSKVNSRLKFLYRYKNCLNQALRKQLCTALVLCHLDYCSTSWFSNLTSLQKHKMQIAVNKVSRYILDFTPRTHIGQSELNQIGILNICDRVKFLRLNHVFKIKQSTGPVYLVDNFISVSHNMQTRACKHDFFVPRVQGIASKTFFFNGIKDWNRLPDSIKSIKNHVTFKHRVKEFLVKSAIGLENCDFLSYPAR